MKFPYWMKLGHMLKTISPKHTCYTTNSKSDVLRISCSLRFTEFTHFPQDASETHASFYSTELQLILYTESYIIILVYLFIICRHNGIRLPLRFRVVSWHLIDIYIPECQDKLFLSTGRQWTVLFCSLKLREFLMFPINRISVIYTNILGIATPM